jgi:DNA-binding response OmpR family regulator
MAVDLAGTPVLADGTPFATRAGMPRIVLIIDPDAPSVKLARAVLEADGWRVAQASDCDHARTELAKLHPHLIVTALAPANGAALELVRDLKAAARDIPIVAVTTLSGPETEYRVLAAGCAGFIYKPISVSTFSAQLRAFLGDRS